MSDLKFKEISLPNIKWKTHWRNWALFFTPRLLKADGVSNIQVCEFDNSTSKQRGAFKMIPEVYLSQN